MVIPPFILLYHIFTIYYRGYIRKEDLGVRLDKLILVVCLVCLVYLVFLE